MTLKNKIIETNNEGEPVQELISVPEVSQSIRDQIRETLGSLQDIAKDELAYLKGAVKGLVASSSDIIDEVKDLTQEHTPTFHKWGEVSSEVAADVIAKIQDNPNVKKTFTAGLGISVVAGFVVGGINYFGTDLGSLQALSAGAKQTLISTGAAFVIAPTYEAVRDRVKEEDKEYSFYNLLPVVVPSVASVGSTFLLHNVLQNPTAALSTLPTDVFTPFSMSLLHGARYLNDYLSKTKTVLENQILSGMGRPAA